MIKSRFTLFLPALLFAVYLSAHQGALAQSTVINAPSTDVVPAKHVYLEFDFLTNYLRTGYFRKLFPLVVPDPHLGIGNTGRVVTNGSRLIPSTHEASRPFAVPSSMNSRANFSWHS